MVRGKKTIVVWGIFLTMGLIIGMFYKAYLEKEIELNETSLKLNRTLEYVNKLEMELAEKNKTIEMYQNKLNELNNTFNAYRDNITKFVSYLNNANARLVYNAMDYFISALSYLRMASDSYDKNDFISCWYNAEICRAKAGLSNTYFKSALNYLDSANKYYNNSEYYEFVATYVKCSQILNNVCEYFAKSCQSYANGDYDSGNSYLRTYNSYIDEAKECMDNVERIYISLTKA